MTEIYPKEHCTLFMCKNYRENCALFKTATRQFTGRNPWSAVDHDGVILTRKVRKKPFMDILIDVRMCA